MPVPTFESVTAADKLADLRGDWSAMLAHQLPGLPAIDDFISSLGDLFEWLGGRELGRLEPAPAVRSVTTDDSWVAPPTMMRWPGGVPLEQIRFAGANHLLVDMRYQGTSRLIEPYALRRSQAGNLLVYAIKVGTGEVRAYRVDRIEGVRVTDRSFVPRYAIELSAARPVTTGRREPRPGARGRRRRSAGGAFRASFVGSGAESSRTPIRPPGDVFVVATIDRHQLVAPALTGGQPVA